MKQIVVFPLGQLSARDKERFTKAGVVWAECQDPSKVVTILPSSSVIGTDDLLMSALDGLTISGSAQIRFADELTKRLKKQEGSKP